MSKQENSDIKDLSNKNKNMSVDESSQSRDAARYQPGGSQFFGALENSASLEEPKFIHQSPATVSVVSTENSSQSSYSTPLIADHQESSSKPNLEVVPKPTLLERNETIKHLSDADKLPFEETISLLEERLVIDSHRRKIGEVIVRKEIETRIIEVPVRREKLIVEQVSPTYQQLAVVDLGQIQETEFDRSASIDTAAHRFDDVSEAIHFLESIAARTDEAQQTVHISIVVTGKSTSHID
ncbi:DUF2382 domain-containing protein [Phormidium sp. CLA17]|uniref:YsnF/AvaK domain-containing protein n=1 Tax=Leptolyngbya sp. Cla-17 TaxID=2803751 RepID=UPI0014924CC5|nr:DUF2382 domain-containing protein [Leptolyngbya sp. Cla-17]MBM0741998.1 DUF2382 domain-containing protein [Leptolyngbya sp. Cla-17]